MPPPDPSAAPELFDLVKRARQLLVRHLQPDGLSDAAAIGEMYRIFDGKAFWAAMVKAGEKPAELVVTECHRPAAVAPDSPSERRRRFRIAPKRGTIP